jgi:hypothetical protein
MLRQQPEMEPDQRNVPVPGREPFAPHRLVVVLAILVGVERVIAFHWGVQIWSGAAVVLLLVALGIQRLLARSGSSSPLRPLTMITVAVAVVITVLVALSGEPTDKWLLAVWLVPLAVGAADAMSGRLTPAALSYIVATLLSVIVLVQLVQIEHAHRRHTRSTAFDNSLIAICADTASLLNQQPSAWVIAAESMRARLAALTPPDRRRRELLGYLIAELEGAERFQQQGNVDKQREWIGSAQDSAHYLGITNCGVF